MDFVSELQEAVVSFLVVVLTISLSALTTVVIAYVRTKLEELKARLGDNLFYQLVNLARIAVAAAEQSGLKGHIENLAAEKKAFAVAAVQDWLNQRGLSGVSAEAISLAIEAALREGAHRGGAVLAVSSVAQEVSVEADVAVLTE